MTSLAILQPGYLPWLGFFDQMVRADYFVYYDNVQFDKHGWRNRNRVKASEGPVWLTVPVLHKGLGMPKILDIEINNQQPWARKQVHTIRQLYARAPFLDHYMPELEEIICRPWKRLIDLDLAVTEAMTRWLGLKTKVYRASDLGIEGDRSERLLNHCLHFGADHYISGNSARNYLDVELFERHGIKVTWQDYMHPVYPQLHGEFIPFLSAIDLLLNVGPESGRILYGEREMSKIQNMENIL